MIFRMNYVGHSMSKLAFYMALSMHGGLLLQEDYKRWYVTSWHIISILKRIYSWKSTNVQTLAGVHAFSVHHNHFCQLVWLTSHTKNPLNFTVAVVRTCIHPNPLDTVPSMARTLVQPSHISCSSSTLPYSRQKIQRPQCHMLEQKIYPLVILGPEGDFVKNPRPSQRVGGKEWAPPAWHWRQNDTVLVFTVFRLTKSQNCSAGKRQYETGMCHMAFVIIFIYQVC